MTAIHSAWYLSNNELAHEASEAIDGRKLSPALNMLAVTVAHAAYRNGTLTLPQADAAELAGISTRSVLAMYESLVRIGILGKHEGRRGRYFLGTFWRHMDYDHNFQFQPAVEEAEREAKRQKNRMLVITRWEVTRPEYWTDEYDATLASELDGLPGFDFYLDGRLDVIGSKLSPELVEVLTRHHVTAHPKVAE